MANIKLTITEKELKQIYSSLDTLQSLGGTMDDCFNKDCEMGIKMLNKALKRSGYEITTDRIKHNEFKI